MAQLALNKFQTETLEVTTSNQTAYTAPTGYTSIVLYAHVTNVTTSAATFTMTHVRSSTATEIVKDASVPPAVATGSDASCKGRGRDWAVDRCR